MKNIKTCTIWAFTFCFVLSLQAMTSRADEIPSPLTYAPSFHELLEHKKYFDDPRPYLTEWGPKQIIPPALWDKLTYDVDKMKEVWTEAVGFKAPDVVGKIAPELKPGKYSYKDKEKYPGLKELMIPLHYEKYFAPGAPPHAGNFPEIEVVPTKQYYWALPVGEATIKNEGKTKLDKDGYLITDSWISGFPFPKPSGKFKAQQIMYNTEKRYMHWGLNMFMTTWMRGFDKNHVLDSDGIAGVRIMHLEGRVLMPPYGFYDERAKTRKERNTFLVHLDAPRDRAGMADAGVRYSDDKAEQRFLYIPSLRRIRKLSTTDTQDPTGGSDQIYDDYEGFNQKLSPTRYPYKYEVIDEREFLIPSPSWDGSNYISSEGLEWRNIQFERRPMWVVKMTQLDPNYVYGHRIVYIDKETFMWTMQNYDQKGRLYRTFDANFCFIPEMGSLGWGWSIMMTRDWIDEHTTIGSGITLPAFWTRKDISLRGLVRKSK